MPIARHWFLPLRQTDPQTYQGLAALMDYVENLAGQLGLEPQAAAQVAAGVAVPPPLPASGFAVAGNDGLFAVTITNHPQNAQPVYHEVASATTLNFDAPGGLVVYGADIRTRWEISDPGAVRYWRLRSKFLNSDFNSARYYQAANASGPTAVAAGLLRASSAAARMQRTASYVTVWGEYQAAGATLANGDSSDGTPTIDFAAAHLLKDGGATSVPIAKTTVRGLTAGATYAVAWDTANGAVHYSTDAGSLLADTLVYLGTVPLPSTPGGAASSAGGGPGGTGVASNGGQYVYG